MLDRSRKADKRKEEKAKRPSSKKVKHGEKEKEGVEEEEKLSSADDSGIESLTSFVYSHLSRYILQWLLEKFGMLVEVQI